METEDGIEVASIGPEHGQDPGTQDCPGPGRDGGI